MDAIEAIRSRRSIRSYKDTPVEREKVLSCLEAARWAPSAGNRQPWEFLVVRDVETRKKLAETHRYAKFIAQSPVAVIFIADPKRSGRTHHIDTSLAAMNFMLAAHAEGLGTCWAGVYDTDVEAPIRDLLGIPSDLRVLALMSLGYPNEAPSRERAQLSQMVHWERYGGE